MIGGAEVDVGSRSTFTVDGGYTQANARTSPRSTWRSGTPASASITDSRGTPGSSSATRTSRAITGPGSTRARTTSTSASTIGGRCRKRDGRSCRSTRARRSPSRRSPDAASRRSGRRRLTHYMKRTWTAVVEYRRRLQYVDGFDRPLFGDAVTTGFNGLLSRRMELVGRASYTSGTVGLSSGAPRFESYAASLRLRRALSRRLAGVRGRPLLSLRVRRGRRPRPPGLPPTFDRLAFRCGLSLWVPLRQ